MEQMPPPYSAKKIAGTPAYKLAREGKPVELKKCSIEITAFEIVALDGAEARFEMSISAGGYVRSVAHELGLELCCGAHLSSLRRTRAGVFTLDEAHTLEELQTLAGNFEALEMLSIHPRSLLPQMPCVTGDAIALGRLRNGAQANLPEFSNAPLVKVFASQRELVGIAKRIAGTLFQPVVGMG
jgi:tRNA pseudouridine55 synthase